MLTYLKVRDLVIVEEMEIEPGNGLNVLTGETGAGKSLLIDSLEFLSGARGSTEMIRAGAEKMSAEAMFEETIVKREINTSGRGRASIDGSLFSVRELAAAMDPLLEIHGQSASHNRIAGQSYRELLDQFGGHKLDAVRSAFHEWRDAASKLDELSNANRDRALKIDLLKYQIDEIAPAKLDPNEEDSLRGERAILANAQQMIEATAGAFTAIEEDENSALAQLARASHLLQPLREIASMRALSDDLQEITYRLQDVARAISAASDVRHDPKRLDAIEERLATIDRLKKKYGGSIDAVLEHLAQIKTEYDNLCDFEGSLGKLQKLESQRRAAYRKEAEKLSAARRKSAKAFETAIQNELRDLAMERTTVRITIDEASDSENGFDRVEVLVAPNRGEEPKPMQRIASGGELSRIQLAIAAALFKASPNSKGATLVFDEIDAGIGGHTARAVGSHLRELAEGRQILCITHLPQVAAMANSHFTIVKDGSRAPAVTTVAALEGDGVVAELVRMLGADEDDRAARGHARELLKSV